MIVNYVVNAARGVLHGFYIFKAKRIKKDYIQRCKLGSCMEMQEKTWMTRLFKLLKKNFD